MMIEITRNGVSIEGRELPLYSGAVHYWRTARCDWQTLLDQVVELGFGIVETYIPWAVHEYEEGCYDFGEIVAEKNLDEFLAMCEARNLKVLVRPGPHINAEMANFGFPHWILMDPEIQAKSPFDTPVIYPHISGPFPIPSYASEKLLEKFKVYFNQLLPVLRKHDYPQGGIIGIQADNELCYFFRDGAYMLDYSAAAIRQYRQMLLSKYQDISEINEIYQTSYAGIDDICPPRGFAAKLRGDLPYYLDWAEYKEYQIIKGLEFFAGLIKDSGLHAFVFHNCANQIYTPVSMQRIEAIPAMDLVGVDAYPKQYDTIMLKERIRYLAAASILPYVPEFGSGAYFDKGSALSAEAEEYGYLYAFMNGMKAVNFYMLADRSSWYGCPLGNDGSRQEPFFSMFRNMITMLNKSGLYEYQRAPAVLVLKNYGMGRLKNVASIFDPNPLVSNCLMRGPEFPRRLFIPEVGQDIAMDTDRSHWGRETWIDMVCEYLEGQGIEYNLSDQYISKENLMTYQVIYASMYEFLDSGTAELLNEYCRNGGALIVGPRRPVLNERFARAVPDMALWRFAKDREELEAVSEPVCSSYWVQGEGIEYAVHYGTEDHILFVANTAGEDRKSVIRSTGKTVYKGVWHADDYISADEWCVTIPAYSICIWKVKEVLL